MVHVEPGMLRAVRDNLNYAFLKDALEEAASSVGCLPPTAESSIYLHTLEHLGLVRQSQRARIWFITKKGQTVLSQIRLGAQPEF
jgi:hypothetical protein